MKVVIIGGYGVFGALTARMLARDGHQLWLAGRNAEKGRKLAGEIGADVMTVDLRQSPEGVFSVAPDVVIDAAGPFQDYGDDAYKLPRLCIAHGCHYLDLSDSSAFTKGIESLNAQAKAAGVFVVSGASSVPGLSSTIVADLIRDMDAVDSIDIAILPGNRAPRGMSVIKSVLGGAGNSFDALRAGVWQRVVGWSDRKLYQLEPGLTRAGYLVDVPDIQLLPDMTGAGTVSFRAGLELPIMNGALAALAWLRQWWRFDLPQAGYAMLHVLSKWLFPFGSDRGGMQVNVRGMRAGQPVTKSWTLIAEKGDGPYVPGTLCRAILRAPHLSKPGARPCLAEISRNRAEAAMSDLRIRFEEV